MPTVFDETPDASEKSSGSRAASRSTAAMSATAGDRASGYSRSSVPVFAFHRSSHREGPMGTGRASDGVEGLAETLHTPRLSQPPSIRGDQGGGAPSSYPAGGVDRSHHMSMKRRKGVRRVKSTLATDCSLQRGKSTVIVDGDVRADAGSSSIGGDRPAFQHALVTGAPSARKSSVFGRTNSLGIVLPQYGKRGSLVDLASMDGKTNSLECNTALDAGLTPAAAAKTRSSSTLERTSSPHGPPKSRTSASTTHQKTSRVGVDRVSINMGSERSTTLRHSGASAGGGSRGGNRSLRVAEALSATRLPEGGQQGTTGLLRVDSGVNSQVNSHIMGLQDDLENEL